MKRGVRMRRTMLYKGDLPEEYVVRIRKAGIAAWDIETSGLDWRTDQIGTCQLSDPNGSVALVKINSSPPKKLILLLEDPAVKKIFHHAMFDLRFMAFQWNAKPQSIACTKIASRLLDPKGERNHSLLSIVREYLGVTLTK